MLLTKRHFFRLYLLDSFVSWKTEQETFLQKLNSYVSVLEHLFVGAQSSVSLSLSRNMLEMLLIGMFQSLHGYPADRAINFAKALVHADLAWELFLKWKPSCSLGCQVVYISSLQSENGSDDWKVLCEQEIKVLFTKESHIDLQQCAAEIICSDMSEAEIICSGMSELFCKSNFV